MVDWLLHEFTSLLRTVDVSIKGPLALLHEVRRVRLVLEVLEIAGSLHYGAVDGDWLAISIMRLITCLNWVAWEFHIHERSILNRLWICLDWVDS